MQPVPAHQKIKATAVIERRPKNFFSFAFTGRILSRQGVLVE